MKQLHMKQ